MLHFASASTRMVNSRRAIAECLEAALGENAAHCDVVVVHAAMGHDFQALLEGALEVAPRATVLGASCCGVVGREGVSESMKDVAVMTIRSDGPSAEFAAADVDDIHGHNSFEKAAELARRVQQQLPDVTMVDFLASGIDIDNDQCIAGIESVLGPDVTIFGATSSDNMRGITSLQIAGGEVREHGAWLLGFADPSLRLVTHATHGFVAVGDPLLVTRSEGNRILELNGRPAWQEYIDRLGLGPQSTCGDSIPVGALAERLSPELAEEYGNEHILRVVTRHDEDGVMHYATTCPEGTELWLTVRDEDRIFGDLDRMMRRIQDQAPTRFPVAVFHADCLARGRFLFNRVLKEELVGCMQHPLTNERGEVPAWLGMYVFGEFARLGGRNTYHNYTTALYALYRDES
jgi:hypothetical protein